MDAEGLARALEERLAPLRDELTRIRAVLERLEAALTRVTDAVPEAPTCPEVEPPARAHVAPVESAVAPTPSSAAVAEPAAELLRQLLADYPEDAAAVYFGFDRQQRCDPDRIDRLARQTHQEAAWHAANRATLRSLLDRYNGGLHIVAEMLGRDTDSLLALVNRIGMRNHVEAVRVRERERLQQAPLAVRLAQLLFREKLVRDLGVCDELDACTHEELRERCSTLSGDCESPMQVLEGVAAECGLDANGLHRMVRRYDLLRFTSDLFAEPAASAERAAPRRSPRPESRRPLDDDEIEMRILRMLVTKRKFGASHTHIDHLVRTVPAHERGRARAIIDRLIADGCLALKVTGNSSEPHVSLAVAAMPAIERRLQQRAAQSSPATVESRASA